MGNQQVDIQSIMESILQAFVLGMKIEPKLLPNITINTFFQDVCNLPSREVSVKADSEKEYIEFDVDKMELNKFYIINYQNESYATRKLGNDQVAFYDVIE